MRLWLRRGGRQPRPCFSSPPASLRSTTARSSRTSSEWGHRFTLSLSHIPLLLLISLPSFFFPQGGEVTRPLDPSPLFSAGALPPPLIPLPKRRASDCDPAEEEEGKEAPTLPQDLGTNLSLELGEPEVAAEAYVEVGGTPRGEEELSDLEERGTRL